MQFSGKYFILTDSHEAHYPVVVLCKGKQDARIHKRSTYRSIILGCVEHQDTFIGGFNEMKRRIKPSLIIVYGDLLPGITGRILRIPYSESFARKSGAKQLRMPEVPRVTMIKAAM